MPADMKINYLELPARDLDRAETFYSRVFDLTFTDYGPEYRAFSNAGIEGGFYKSALNASTDNGAPLIVFYASDLEGARDAVVAAGGQVVKDIFDFPGGRRFHFTDPNDNELAIWSGD